MAEEEEDPKVNHPCSDTRPRPPPFVEVVCKSSGKKRRFAAGTEARFAASLINRKLNGGAPLAWNIEAVKEGEEPVSFGPNSVIVDYSDGWKLQTVTEPEGFRKAERIQPSTTRVPSVTFVEVVCKSSGKKRRFAAGTETRFAVSLINRKLNGGAPLAWYIEAVKEGEEPVSFGPNSVIVDYSDGWKLQTVTEPEGFRKGEGIQPSTTRVSSVTGLNGTRAAKRVSEPVNSFQYIGKILVAFILIFVLGAIFTLALENLPKLILFINSSM